MTYPSCRLVAVGAAALLAAGCGSDVDAGPPPLETSTERSEVCAPPAANGLVTFGVETTRNMSKKRITITGARLKDPDGLELVAAKVILLPEDGDETLVGVSDGWPPSFTGADKAAGKRLADAPEAKGTKIPPSSKPLVTFALGVKSKMSGGHSGPLEVDYKTEDGDKFTWTGTSSYRTTPKACK